jgi:hypothetical protein
VRHIEHSIYSSTLSDRSTCSKFLSYLIVTCRREWCTRQKTKRTEPCNISENTNHMRETRVWESHNSSEGNSLYCPPRTPLWIIGETSRSLTMFTWKLYRACDVFTEMTRLHMIFEYVHLIIKMMSMANKPSWLIFSFIFIIFKR